MKAFFFASYLCPFPLPLRLQPSSIWKRSSWMKIREKCKKCVLTTNKKTRVFVEYSHCFHSLLYSFYFLLFCKKTLKCWQYRKLFKPFSLHKLQQNIYYMIIKVNLPYTERVFSLLTVSNGGPLRVIWQLYTPDD